MKHGKIQKHMFSQLGINRIREKDISLCMYNGASPEAFGEILFTQKNITNYNKIHTCPALFEKILYYWR